MKQLWSYPNIISTTCKDLSHTTCFNCEKKGHYATRFSELERKINDSFDDLHFGDWSSLLPRNALFVFDTWFNSKKRYVGLDGFDSQDGHNSHDKFNTPGQAGKGLIIPKDLLLADASMVFHLQQCRHTVCREGACLDDLHSCE